MGVYTQAKMRLAQGLLRWETGNIRAMLMSSMYAYNFVHQRVSDIVANEVSGGTYARVDVPLRELRVDVLGNRVLLWAPHIIFPELSGVAPRGMVLYEQGGPDENTPNDDWLVAYLDFGGVATTTGLDFLVEFDSEGVIAIQDC